jgi:hypothetical protein
MEEDKRNRLEAKLKKMIKHFDEAEAERKQPAVRSGRGNVIRRREGQKEKRFEG